MFSFEGFVDLPLVWFGLIGVALFLYVLLDGFDLGVGILFPFAPTDQCRDRLMNSIAPFWDGNETWLVLSGGGLFAAFPLAYAILMPALYLPVIFMLLGLIFRGVAFEFRFKAVKSRRIWDYAFHFGSLLAAFMQGMIIGAFVQGVKVEGRSFAGGAFDWLNAYSVMTGLALVFGYALLGSTWLVMKTDGITQGWARKCAAYVLGYVGLFLAIVSISMPMMNAEVRSPLVQLAQFLLSPAHTSDDRSLLCRHLARSAPGQRESPLFPEPRGLPDGLPGAGHQPLAMARSFCGHLSAGRGGTSLPIAAARRHRRDAAHRAHLHGILLLSVQRESLL